MKILLIFGTRPEAIKMAPLVKALQADIRFSVVTCVTGQHREMLDQVLSLFELKPDYDLNVMKPEQSLVDVTCAVLKGATEVIAKEKPDLVFVHGDVTSGAAGALAAFYQKIPVGHIEAGLRTGDIYSPFPEEMNRKLISSLATFHFAPTERNKNNLLKENIPAGKIFVTGNTVIDALHQINTKLKTDPALSAALTEKFSFLNPDKKLILVTGHRRENLDGGIENICKALVKIAKRGDTQIVYPVHLNPAVYKVAHKILENTPDIFLIPPQDYSPFVYLTDRAYFLVSDSGGVQEEAPSLGKPVLVTRDATERQEAAEAGTVKLVGARTERLVKEITLLLDDKTEYDKMSRARNPYGDGKACERIINMLETEAVSPNASFFPKSA